MGNKNGRELLNSAFGDIDLELIAAADQPPIVRNNTVRWIAVAAACVAVIAIMLPFVSKIRDNSSPIAPPIDPDSGGHDCELAVSEVVPPSCEKGGYTVYGCTYNGCGKTEVRDTVPAKGHGAFTAVTVEAGCLTVGYTAERCGDCGVDMNKRDHTPARVHELRANGDGFVCALCGETVANGGLLTYAELLEEITAAGGSVLVKGDLGELSAGTVADQAQITLDGGRFTVVLSAMGGSTDGLSSAEIINDGGDNYLRITENSASTGVYASAQVNGDRAKAVTVEFSLRLGKADANGKYIPWKGAWQSTDERATKGVMALFQDENGVLSFGNSEFSLQLSEERFTRVRLVYRFYENAYDVYIDGVLCGSGVPITEEGADALDGFEPDSFWYAVALPDASTSEERYFELGSFVAYQDE